MTNPGLAEMDATIFADMLNAGLGDSATFYSEGDGVGIPCTVLVDRSALYQDPSTGIPSTATTIRVQRADIGASDPPLKSFFVVDGKTYVVDKIDPVSDESAMTLIVVPQGC